MVAKHIDSAMRLAHYEIVEDDNSIWGEIPGVQGVWAKQPTLEACREELPDNNATPHACIVETIRSPNDRARI